MGKWYLMISFTHSRLLHNAIWRFFCYKDIGSKAFFTMANSFRECTNTSLKWCMVVREGLLISIHSPLPPRTHINHRPLNRPIKWPNANLSNTLISVSMLIWKTGIGHCGNDVAQKTVAKVFVLSATKFLAKSDLHWIGDCHVWGKSICNCGGLSFQNHKLKY